VRWFLVAVILLLCGAAASAEPAFVPAPASISPLPAAMCPKPLALDRSVSVSGDVDPGGFELLAERWTALGIPPPVRGTTKTGPNVVLHREPSVHGYVLTAGEIGIAIVGGTADDLFDGMMTLAQLPERREGHWIASCVHIGDAPAMRWRIVSDDVSRGPFPTAEYARRRIRTLASLKINGWSPYMEQVLADARAPYVASPSGWTAAELHELAVYARRFHVALIPEQQTFAHMHESLKWESLAPLAELPHGYLVAESDAATYRYLEPLVKSAVAAAAPAPFVHLGADEPLDLGRGRTPRTAQAFAEHVKRVAAYLGDGATRPMIWDDAVQQDRSILPLLPKNVVIVAFHYGVEPTYKPYLDTIANAGFDQMISPSAANFNELYPDLATSYTNVARFAAEAKRTRGMLGMFMTVWHDDGETLFEATWPALAYAAATAWQQTPVDDAGWHRSFARAFFGTDDAAYASDLDALQAMRPLIRTTPSDPPDHLFWRDPFDPALQARARALDLTGLRIRAEAALAHLWTAHPPLHAEAAAAMRLGALRYDQLGRRLQIGREAREYYDDARAHATKPEVSQVYRSLNVAKYLCWELRNGIADLAPLYETAWRSESTPPGLERMRAHYRVAEDDAQRCADRIDRVTREDYLRHGVVPPWDEVMSSAR
jgi:hypothetical protein